MVIITYIGLVVHDGIDFDGRRLHVGDIADDSVFYELAALAARRVVREYHAGVPCPSFGTLRRPQVRSKDVPFGFNPDDPYTAYHNLIARRTAIVLTLALKMGSYISVEQPRNSRLFLLHCYRVLVTLGCVITHFSFCAFGSGFHKPSKWLHNKPWLLRLQSKCECPNKGKHFVVQGTFTKASVNEFDKMCRPNAKAVYGLEPVPGQRVSEFSAAYPLRLVDAMAYGSKAAKFSGCSQIPLNLVHQSLQEVGVPLESIQPLPEVPYPPRPWFEDPEWINELCECLQFKELFRFKFHKPGHINVNETRTYKSWLKSMARHERDTRFIGLLDSRVTLGAAAKGRSSSFAISRILQGSLGFVIGGNLYPGGLHCYSAANRADDPSRDRPVRGPTKKPPGWLCSLQAGKPEAFDQVIQSSRIARNPARWLRFLLLLCGDIERNPGPLKVRGKMDLNVGFAPQTASRMASCLEAFKRWVCEVASFNWEELTADPSALAWALRAYGVHCYESGLPRYLLVYAITAIQDAYPQAKPSMGLAWQIDKKKWQVAEPGACRAVLPAIAIRAILAVASLWGWIRWTGVVLIGFCGMLHPSEIVNLVRKDLVFPKDVAYDMPCMYVHLRNPKTARYARRQHARIDDDFVISLLEVIFKTTALDEKLYPASLSLFRKQWNAIMQSLGIPFKQECRGATPGTLTGSGATFLYGRTEDVPWIAWRGRWARQKTLEYYLQEVSAQLLLHELSSLSKFKIEQFSKFSWSILCTQCGLHIEGLQRSNEEVEKA